MEAINLVQSHSKGDSIKLLGSTLRCILQYDRSSLDNIYKEQGTPWQNFMDDIVLYYVARLVLTETPIPLSIESSLDGVPKNMIGTMPLHDSI